MSEAATKLLEQLLQLPEADRRHIADRLRESVGDDADGTDEELLPDDPGFYEELSRRSDEARDHPEQLLDGEQVFREARERLWRRRES